VAAVPAPYVRVTYLTIYLGTLPTGEAFGAVRRWPNKNRQARARVPARRLDPIGLPALTDSRFPMHDETI